MLELSLREIQVLELNLLLQFHEVCNNNNLRYSLGGGTLLGAIRHKGFIPWDDDVDVMMPRPDYESFINYCKNSKTEFNIITYNSEENYNALFARIWDPNTIIFDPVSEINYEMGVGIDVFPIDGLGNTEREAYRIFNKTAWNREVLNALAWKRFFRSKTHSIFVEPIRFAMFVVSRFANPKKLLHKVDRENLSHPFEMSNYAGCVCGSYREKEIMTRDTFEKYCEVDFEGHKLKSIQNFDGYLTKHYGEYMIIPPEEKRQTHHTYKAYKKDNINIE